MTQISKPDSQQPSRRHPTTTRVADLEDLSAILGLEQSLPSAAHWSADHYRSRIQSQPEEACVLVAESGDAENTPQFRGFLCARLVAGEWEIENVAVHPASRRQGIGAQLLQSLRERWQAAAGTALLLEVRESNHAARALYERHGFREVGRRSAYYRNPQEDAVLYTLDRRADDSTPLAKSIKP